ncbi:MAG: hypothetical protein ACU84Q_19385 [Gammaproteobacteria bacterium]
MIKFRILLWSIGMLLWIASRTSVRLRSQLSRDMTVSVGCEDGVWRSYRIANRRVSSFAKVDEDALLMLSFKTADLGFQVLLAPDAINRILDGFSDGEIVCRGEAAHVLWFYELIMGLKPWRRKPQEVWPDSYTKPNYAHKVSSKIIREPVTDAVDPTWQEAHEQRAKTILWRVGRGATPEGKFKQHRIVINQAEIGEVQITQDTAS